jgi:hypothetical protein
MLADAHFSLFTEAALAEHWPDHEYDSAKRKGKGLHKRTISAAIPSTEEVVAADGGLRKSLRQRKPTTRS